MRFRISLIQLGLNTCCHDILRLCSCCLDIWTGTSFKNTFLGRESNDNVNSADGLSLFRTSPCFNQNSYSFPAMSIYSKQLSKPHRPNKLQPKKLTQVFLLKKKMKHRSCYKIQFNYLEDKKKKTSLHQSARCDPRFPELTSQNPEESIAQIISIIHKFLDHLQSWQNLFILVLFFLWGSMVNASKNIFW